MYRKNFTVFLLVTILCTGCRNPNETPKSKEAKEVDSLLFELKEEERNEVQRDVILEVIELDTFFKDTLQQDSLKTNR